MVETWKPIQHESNRTGLFIDDMNGDNTEAGLNARGRFFECRRT
ncbi:MAG: hypothetical protein WBH40_05140 [Ignavibacteriaceae bacterium]